jgi:hypothetical protein
MAMTQSRFTSHKSEAGRWCRWSLVRVSQRLASGEDKHCPADCPDSDIEEVPQP